ncbi:MAG: class I SAM-dependent methyltransferase [Candidatus Bathyarchaeia archaeon]
MSHPKEYTWDQCYLDEYAKGKRPLHGEKPDGFVVWASKYLKEKGMSGAIILDAGCGEGRNSIYLAKQGFKIYGIDIALPAIETGKRWVKSEGLTEMVNLRVGDITKLPYEDNFFDAVIDSYTMEFIPKKEDYVKEVVRVLKSEGLFFILTSISPAKHSINPEYLEKMLEKNFKILKINNPSSVSLSIVAKKDSQ